MRRRRGVVALSLVALGAVAGCGGAPEVRHASGPALAADVVTAGTNAAASAPSAAPAPAPAPAAPAPAPAPPPPPAAPRPKPSAEAFCAALSSEPLFKFGIFGGVSAREMELSLSAEADFLRTVVKPVTPAVLIGELDRLILDLRIVAAAMNDTGAADAVAVGAQMDPAERSTLERIAATAGEPDEYGDVAYPNELAAWMAPPCGPKPKPEPSGGSGDFEPIDGFEPIGDTL